MPDFTLRDIPPGTWAEFTKRATSEGRPLRPLLLMLIQAYTRDGLPADDILSPVMTSHAPGQVSFTVVCPNGHAPTETYDRAALERYLQAGELPMYCIFCNIKWNASEQVLSNLKRRLAEGTI